MTPIPESTLLTRIRVIIDGVSDRVSDLFSRLLYYEYARRTGSLSFEPGDVTPGERAEAVAALCGELGVGYEPGKTDQELDAIVTASLGRTLVVLWNWLVDATTRNPDEKWDVSSIDQTAKFLSSYEQGVKALFLSAFPPEEIAAVLGRFEDSEKESVIRELGKIEAFHATGGEILKQAYDLVVYVYPGLAASREVQDVFDRMERLDRNLIQKLSRLSDIVANVLSCSPGRSRRIFEVLTPQEIATLICGSGCALRSALLPELPTDRLHLIREEIVNLGQGDISTAASARLLVVEALRRLSKRTQFWGFVRGESIVGCSRCGRTFAVPVSKKRVVAKCPHCEETRIIRPIRKTEQLLIPRVDSSNVATPVIQNVTSDEVDGYIRDAEIDLKLIERQQKLDDPDRGRAEGAIEELYDLFTTFSTNMKDLFFIHLSKKLSLTLKDVRQGAFDTFVSTSGGASNIYILADFLQGATFLLEVEKVLVSSLLAVLRERVKDGVLIETPPERRVFHYFIDIFNRALKTIEPRESRFDFHIAGFYDSITKVIEFRPGDQVTLVSFEAELMSETGLIRAFFPTQLISGFSFPSKG